MFDGHEFQVAFALNPARLVEPWQFKWLFVQYHYYCHLKIQESELKPETLKCFELFLTRLTKTLADLWGQFQRVTRQLPPSISRSNATVLSLRFGALHLYATVYVCAYLMMQHVYVLRISRVQCNL